MLRFFLLVCFALSVQFLNAAPQPDKVAEVAAGKLKEAKVSWWGFNTEDSTEFLKAAFKSKASKVIVDKQATPWVAGPLALPSSKEIVFEEGVELLAKAGLFQGRNSSLLSASNTKNLKLVGLGKGATLRMRKSDYQAEPYEKAEWRHGISLRSVENVTVENLSIVSSGGDGIYLGVTTRGVPCRNVTIRKVVCDDNHRQGISVISADKLLIEDCVLKNTWGTAPQAGIDFEPNNSSEQLTDCVMRRCVVEGNAGNGITLYLRYFQGTPTPMSVRIEDCIAKGNKRNGFSYSRDNGIKGSCEVINCRFENNEESGILVRQKDAESTALTMKETTIIHKGEENPPIRLLNGESFDFGGIDFGTVRLTDDIGRFPVSLGDPSGLPRNVRGTLHVQHGGATKTIGLDDAWFVKEYPAAVRGVPLVEPVPERFVPLKKANVNVDTEFPPIWQRRHGKFWIYAEKGTPIRFALAVRQIGRNEIGSSPGVLTLPDGKTNRFNIPADKAKDFEFVLADAPATGVYRLSVEVGGHAVQMLRCNQTVVLPTVPQLDLFATVGTLYFPVPPGSKEFGIGVRGEPGEPVQASVVDPSGKTVWTKDNIVDPVRFSRLVEDSDVEGIWQIILDRPSKGRLDDYRVTLLGVPPLLGLNPTQLLVPQK